MLRQAAPIFSSKYKGFGTNVNKKMQNLQYSQALYSHCLTLAIVRPNAFDFNDLQGQKKPPENRAFLEMTDMFLEWNNDGGHLKMLSAER